MPGVFVVNQDIPVGRVIDDLLILIECSEKEDWISQVFFHPCSFLSFTRDNHVSAELQDKYPSVNWSHIVGMRNRLIHGYDDIDFEILYQTIRGVKEKIISHSLRSHVLFSLQLYHSKLQMIYSDPLNEALLPLFKELVRILNVEGKPDK